MTTGAYCVCTVLQSVAVMDSNHDFLGMYAELASDGPVWRARLMNRSKAASLGPYGGK